MEVGFEGYSLVYEKFGLAITDAMELDMLSYNRLLRDAIVLKLKETEVGQKYLKDCYRYEQTEPDYEAIRKFNNLGGKPNA